MRRVAKVRSNHPDLLTQSPWTAVRAWRTPTGPVVDPVDQLRELADLYRRGLLSKEEFALQRAKVLTV